MYNYSNRPRRQDFNKKDLIYDENGSVYIFTNKIFIEKNNRLGGKIGHYIFKEEYGKQIDTYFDLHILNSIAQYLNKDKNSEYSKHITWVEKENYLSLKEESYDTDDLLLKTKEIKYSLINELVPELISLVNNITTLT
mgnify:CR=1 FL=1